MANHRIRRTYDNDQISYVPSLHNVISCSYLGCEINLNKLALRARNAEYNPQSFQGLFMRIRNPKSTSLVFKSGKMVCAGAKNLKDAIIAARKHARIVQKYFPDVVFQGFQIHNIVGSWKVDFQLYLSKLEHCNINRSLVEIRYHPESFPGMYITFKKLRVTLSVFRTGKVCIIGAKKLAVIPQALKKIYPLLKKCENTGKRSNV